jgi:NAD(P)-dependent dehydrogenase (short-subunit alcohol dehydrogenase family)
MKNLVVSGASRGIGKAIVLHFAKAGWNVAFCSRNVDNLNHLKDACEQLNREGRFLGFQCDVSQAEEVKIFAAAAQDFLGSVDVLVNNAGVFLPGQVHEMSDEDFDSMMQTNVYSAFHLSKALIPEMKKYRIGHIFNMSSIAGLMAYPNGGAYNVSKHALTGYSKTLRDELKAYGIRVTGIYPGAVLTDSWAGVDLPEERFMSPEDIAQTIWDIHHLSPRTVVEDIVLRPQLGDI